MFYTKGVRARVSRGEGESVFCTLTVTVNTFHGAESGSAGRQTVALRQKVFL